MPGRMPQTARLDIAYLGASFLEATGLAASPLLEDLLRLRDLCGGRFHTCRDRVAVDRHLRRRVDSGFLRFLRDSAPES